MFLSKSVSTNSILSECADFTKLSLVLNVLTYFASWPPSSMASAAGASSTFLDLGLFFFFSSSICCLSPHLFFFYFLFFYFSNLFGLFSAITAGDLTGDGLGVDMPDSR